MDLLNFQLNAKDFQQQQQQKNDDKSNHLISNSRRDLPIRIAFICFDVVVYIIDNR